MPDFDVPNIGKARAALTALAKEERTSKGLAFAKTQLIRTLYTEIRQARLAGHSWRGIHLAIRSSNVTPKMSLNFMRNAFRQIDKQFEKETGVKALPPEPRYGKVPKR